MKISGGLDRWGSRFIFIEFQGLEMTYPPIFEGPDINGVFIFT
jgi:hypothetical protein